MSRPLILSLCLLSLACRSSDKSDEGTTTDSADATDSADSASPNSPPVIEAVEFTPNPVRTDDVLTANLTTTDVDDDTIGYTYVWFIDGLVIDDRGAELDGAEVFDKGDTITVSVTPNDGTEDGAPLSAEPIVVRNTPPDAPEISLVDDGDLGVVAIHEYLQPNLVSPASQQPGHQSLPAEV